MGCIIYSPHWHWITPYVDVGVPYMHMNQGTCPYDPYDPKKNIKLRVDKLTSGQVDKLLLMPQSFGFDYQLVNSSTCQLTIFYHAL